MCFYQPINCIMASMKHTWFLLCEEILKFLEKTVLIVRAWRFNTTNTKECYWEWSWTTLIHFSSGNNSVTSSSSCGLIDLPGLSYLDGDEVWALLSTVVYWSWERWPAKGTYSLTRAPGQYGIGLVSLILSKNSIEKGMQKNLYWIQQVLILRPLTDVH